MRLSFFKMYSTTGPMIGISRIHTKIFTRSPATRGAAGHRRQGPTTASVRKQPVAEKFSLFSIYSKN
jgi:hypothetical protein